MPEAGVWVEGKAAGFGYDRDGELIAPGAFERGMADYLRNPIVVYSHATALMNTVTGPSRYVQLGVTTDLRRERDGLLWKAWLPRPAEGSPTWLHDVYAKIRDGIMRGISVGGKFFKDAGSDLISRVDLQEISIAPKPVNPETLITSVTPADTAPELSSCGESCALNIGATGKADPDTVNLSAAFALAEFAAELREVRGHLSARQAAGVARVQRDIARDVARLRSWSL